MEDNHQWKTTSNKRQPPTEDDLQRRHPPPTHKILSCCWCWLTNFLTNSWLTNQILVLTKISQFNIQLINPKQTN